MSKILKRWIQRALTDEQLDELCGEVYDSWCWEDDDPEDLAFYEFLDAERQRRKMPVIESTLTVNAGDINITLPLLDDFINDAMDKSSIIIRNDIDEIVLATVLDEFSPGKK